MRASRNGKPHETLSVELPTDLLDRVRAIHIDRRTGIARYGTMRQTVIEALSLWLRDYHAKPPALRTPSRNVYWLEAHLHPRP